MNTWRGPRGIQVDVIVLDRRPRLRVTQTVGGRTYLVGYYRRPEQLAGEAGLDLADLVEVIPFPTCRT